MIMELLKRFFIFKIHRYRRSQKPKNTFDKEMSFIQRALFNEIIRFVTTFFVNSSYTAL